MQSSPGKLNLFIQKTNNLTTRHTALFIQSDNITHTHTHIDTYTNIHFSTHNSTRTMAQCGVPVSAPEYSPPITYNSDLFGGQPSLNT